MFKNSVIYILGEIISKLGPFILIPYLSKKLGIDGYGQLSLYLSYAQLGIVFIGLGAHSSISRYYFRYGYKNIALPIISYLIYSFIFIVITLVSLYLIGYIEYSFIIFYVLFSYIQTIISTLFQCSKKAKVYVAFQVSYTILNICLTFFVFEFFSSNAIYRINIQTYSYILIIIVVFLCYINKIRKLRWHSIIKYKRIKIALMYNLSFGIPLLLHNGSNFIRSESDKIFIHNYYNMEELGLYSLGDKIGLMSLVLLLAVNKAIQPYVFERIKNKEKLFNNIDIFKCLLLAFIFLFIIYFIPEKVFIYFFSANIKYYVLMFSFSSICLIPYFLKVNVLFYYKKTFEIGLISLVSSVIYLFFIFVFSQKFSINMIPIVSIISNVMLSVLTVLFVNKKLES